MKIAISSKGKTLESSIDPQFGRCAFFIIAEIEGKKVKKIEASENTSANQAGGAGILAAQKVAEQGARIVITGNVGPRAMDVLKQFKIEAFQGEGKIKKVTEDFLENKLKKIQ